MKPLRYKAKSSFSLCDTSYHKVGERIQVDHGVEQRTFQVLMALVLTKSAMTTREINTLMTAKGWSYRTEDIDYVLRKKLVPAGIISTGKRGIVNVYKTNKSSKKAWLNWRQLEIKYA